MDFDISGPTSDCRFPWQRDVAVQCTSAPPEAADGSPIDGAAPPEVADGSPIDGAADDVVFSYNLKIRSPSLSDRVARGEKNTGKAVNNVNGRTSSDSSLRDHQHHHQLQQRQQSLPGSPPVRQCSKERQCDSPQFFSSCSADSLNSIGDERAVDDEENKHMRNYSRTAGLGRRPAVISAYNFLGNSPAPESSSDSTDKITEEVAGVLSDDEMRRGEHRTNSMSAISRSAAYGSNQPLSGSKDADLKLKSRSLTSVLRLGPGRKKKPEAFKTFLLNTYRRKEFGNDHLASYKRASLADILVSKDIESGDTLSDAEMKKREAMWEVFTNECTFLFDHLLVLRHCFLDPLREAQVEGHLLEVDLPRLFGNLEDLCQISYAFCQEFMQSLRSSAAGFCSMDNLVACLVKMVENSHDGDAYEEYVLKYKGAVSYLSSLRESVPDFVLYESFCSQDARCNRLRLKDLLVAPMHHWTRLPVILKNVCKRTKLASEKEALSAAIAKVELSLRLINDKMEELKPLERLQELQKLLVWPTIADLDPKAYVPEFVRDLIHDEPREVDLTDQRRELIHEGSLQLLQGDKEKPADVYVFLLSDMVLITKIKKEAKKKDSQKKISVGERSGGEVVYHIQKQPMPVDSISVYDIKQRDLPASVVKNVFALTQHNAYQQTTAVATFQAPSEEAKTRWLECLRQATDRQHGNGSSSRHDSFSRHFTEEEREKLRRCTRLLSLDDAPSRGKSRSSLCATDEKGSDGGAGGVHGSGAGGGGGGGASGGGLVGAKTIGNWVAIVTSSSAIAKATTAMGQQSTGGTAATVLPTPSERPQNEEVAQGRASQVPELPLKVGGDAVNHQLSVDSADAVFF